MGDDLGANNINITGSTFLNNSADGQGGALYLLGGVTTLTDCVLSNNSAGLQGGGIVFVNICGKTGSCHLDLLGGTRLMGNKAQTGGGVFMGVPGNWCVYASGWLLVT
jgi:predicted outer membrane repeat protein